MTTGIEYLPDGTIKFYQNKIVNLIASIASLLGLIIFAFIIFYFGLYEEKFMFFAFCLMILIEMPIIIFFLFRFLKPKVLLLVNSQGVEIYGNKLTWEQIYSARFEEDLFIFKSKNNKCYRFLTNIESQTILKEIFSKHGINWQE